MSLVDLFRNRAAGNHGNHGENTLVTAASHATPNGNQSNHGNHKNVTHEELNEQPAQKGGVYCYRVTDNPRAVLTNIAPESDLSGVWDSLRLRYGERLIDVYPVSETKH